MGVLTGFDAESRISVPLYHESTFSFEFAAKKLAKKLTFRKSQLICTSQAKVDTQTRKYTPKLFGRAFDIVLESDNSMRTQDVLRCRT